MDTRVATLVYLSNPTYQNNLANTGITRQPITRESISISDKRFYRKRTINLFKNVFKDNKYPDDIKTVHEEFTHSAIKYFKLIDKRDIVQEGHDADNIAADAAIIHSGQNASNIKAHEISQDILSKANHEIMKVKTTGGNLDAFVERKTLHVVPPMKIPSKKAIDLKAPALKKKGLKPKKLHHNKL